MAEKPRISVVFGTRPEAIKLCPVVHALRAVALETTVCVTGQHRRMLDQVLATFGVPADVDLDLMQPDQTLATLTSRALLAVDAYLERRRPDLLVVQGDTTTALSAALAAFYRRVPVVHVEAGLRTGDTTAPFPEEINRQFISRLAIRHFAPTTTARDNLLGEGVPDERIAVTGNTVIDALRFARDAARAAVPPVPGVPESILQGTAPLVLVTGHRRESFGRGFEGICQGIREVARRFPRSFVVYPVHLNPRVREPVNRLLGGIPNILLVDPLEYLPFVRLMDRATVLLTDSGGIQEEGPALQKPVLVMRDTTERPEVLEAGVARLVGTDPERILAEVSRLLEDPGAYATMARGANPYGDGHAAERIADECARLLHAGAHLR